MCVFDPLLVMGCAHVQSFLFLLFAVVYVVELFFYCYNHYKHVHFIYCTLDLCKHGRYCLFGLSSGSKKVHLFVVLLQEAEPHSVSL